MENFYKAMNFFVASFQWQFLRFSRPSRVSEQNEIEDDNHKPKCPERGWIKDSNNFSSSKRQPKKNVQIIFFFQIGKIAFLNK